ncbi:cyclic peptide export ABC transporter [Agrobacterium rhizogenes]|uniref:cyclic peptide export ABC transporter n=1 Tax=Rhizobium rhizogenes TaxID=359 RepID=UPI00115E704F|nr:cyclic peptide export ABC transporter [Rhizobium rhizogenes]NTG39377.1 cyclic peptide export ABC transporter [Rhizobium rhizogenes]NTG58628.1 cyclic peptide export ABC transporter [Rhizobium rhizogenes]NTI07173.1 cyclic peptide export ABC transporter [Rhizobium rhizogenes]NTI13984.1 cyclic peptide export ABC transporter [Rhizobium rhizogenes]TRB14821.1 cyclic peptide export ABC transporter [Rhizobium rhizogenes]
MSFWRFIREYHLMILASAVCSVGSAVVTLLFLSQINNLAHHGLGDQRLSALAVGSSLLCALIIVGSVNQILLARLGAQLVSHLRMSLARQLINADYQFLSNRKSFVFGALIEDIGHIAPLMLIVPQVFNSFLLSALCAIYLISISISLFGLLAAFLTFSFAISLLLDRYTRSKFDELRENEELIFESFRSIGDGKKELSLNAGRANHFTNYVLSPAIDRARGMMTTVHLGWGLYGVWSDAIFYGAIFLIVYIGQLVIGLPSTVIFPFVVGAFFLLGPLAFLARSGDRIGAGMASLRHLRKVGLTLQSNLNTAPRLPTQSTSVLNLDNWTSLRLKDVEFRYAGATPSSSLGPISLEIKRGEIVFLVGANGSGKTTLLLLLCSLLKPTSGEIFLHEHSIDSDLVEYRSRLGGVFGDFFLFPHVLDGFGKLVSDQKISELIQDLGLLNHVTSIESRLSTTSLSTGQRKRMALLQCYAEDREICFFDEWAADQDPNFRMQFYLNILPALKRRGKTLIVISHDDRFFHVADQIIELRDGKVFSDPDAQVLKEKRVIVQQLGSPSASNE